MIATFFSYKILKLHSALKSSSTVSSPHIPPENTPTMLSFFPLVSEDEVSKIISHSSKFAYISPVLKCLHWLIHYKVASITYKVLQSEQPCYLHSLLNIQSNRTTRSCDIITLQRPSVRSRLKLTDRSLPTMLL